MKIKHNGVRRGVLLLVVLGLLAMFGLVAVAFVVLTGHAERTATTVQQIEQYPDSPKQLIHQAAMQALRGSSNPFSVLAAHSLLEDLYGYKPTEVMVMTDPAAICGGQLFEFTVSDPERRVGCVLTMLDGTAMGESTLIVGINPADSRVQALAFKKGFPQTGERFVINNAPFSGTGFGYDPNTGRLNLTDSVGRPVALLPGAEDNLFPAGGANEGYDAVDYQNMLLAAQLRDPNTGQVITIPSLHRPALVNYWVNRGGDISDPVFLKSIILRPMPQIHPNFDGGNPFFNPLWDGIEFVDADGDGANDYRWDVDNDGDGITDGIWVDLGMPVRSTRDGRLYKPLFSFLCVDLDGRLNLNAHGNLWQAQEDAYLDARNYRDKMIQGDGSISQVRFAGGAAQARVPWGQGTGPAEINLLPAFEDVTSPGTYYMPLYRQLLIGEPSMVDGRYGEAGVDLPMAGVTGADDPQSWNRNYAYAGNYWGYLSGGNQSMLGAYGSPPDFLGIGGVALDMAGRPLFLSMGQYNDTTTDDHYEIDLSLGKTRGLSGWSLTDNPFSAAEFERIIRPFDRDAAKLPPRLFALTGGVLQDHRHAVTTESWDLPCPSLELPPSLRSGGRAFHFVDLLRAKTGDAPNLWRQLVPPEMLAGLKMDLNRPLGNSRDDNGNGIVDEPAEAPGEQLTLYDRPGSAATVPVDHLNDGDPGSGAIYSRQLHARHLYVLMMLLADQDYLRSQLGSQEKVARFLAQWAVNVVDFRDRDSIMTWFAYDPNPFDGWNPGNSDARIVWGCERPELLITETLAFHDRRTEDLEEHGYCEKPADGGGGGGGGGGGAAEAEEPGEPGEDQWPKESEEDDKKVDLDSRFRPQGSLFIELFNPWSVTNSPSGEFYPYDPSSRSFGGGVLLTKTSGSGAGGSPVWRLVIVDETEGSKPPQPTPPIEGEYLDPDDPDPARRPHFTRAVYFVARNSCTVPTDIPVASCFFATASTNPLVAPGGYAVVGPGSATSATTYIGFRNGRKSGDESTRRIDLSGNLTHVVFPTTGQPPESRVKPPAVVVVSDPHRLNISEPHEGYPTEDYDAATGQYTKVHDVPLDEQRDDEGWWTLLRKDQTVTGFRTVHLQRLADPTQPFNVRSNPYRTIDSMPIDLTTFNGVSTAAERDEDGNPIERGRVVFASRQRGEEDYRRYSGAPASLWKQEPRHKPLGAAAGAPLTEPHYFNDPLDHSLGYLNFRYFGMPLDASQAGNYHRGDPPHPFPWLTWNNRPYISQLELLLVPFLRSSKLLVRNAMEPQRYFDIDRPSQSTNPYDPNSGGPDILPPGPFPHLLNFFHSTSGNPGNSPQLHRIFDFLHVPSRFVGTSLCGDPNVFSGTTGGNHAFHPPFNNISLYREPGRINLNTIFNREVFMGLMNFYPGMNTEAFWEKFVRSRRGYTGSSSGGAALQSQAVQSMLQLNSSFPTRFAQPFKSACAASMAPDGLRPQREIDVTVLRRDPDNPTRPLFETRSSQPYNDTDRNPYFRYQGIQRLGNLVTHRSNVYAMWITVGYFEVEPAPATNAIYPDGYRLGQEIGIDTGDVKRHRAFYLIDRSIPVGFQRGEDLNAEKAILLRRFIE